MLGFCFDNGSAVSTGQLTTRRQEGYTFTFIFTHEGRDMGDIARV